MKKFLFKSTLFLIPLFLIIFIFYIIADNNHEFEPSSMYYYEEFESAFKTKDFDVVAIGNSKLLSAIDKETLQCNNVSVANLGYSSANISVSKLTLEAYLNNCKINPEIVLLEVSWFTFNKNRTYLHQIVGDLFVKDFKLWKNYFNYKSDFILPNIRKSLKTNFKRGIGINPSLELTSYATRFEESSPQSKDYEFEEKEMEVIFPDHTAGIDRLLLDDFYSIIKMCKDRNIGLILFTAPEDSEYSKCQKDVNSVKKIFKNVTDENSDIFYLDYTLGGDLYDKKYEKWLRDSHHINENKLFSNQLLKDIKEYTHQNVYTK